LGTALDPIILGLEIKQEVINPLQNADERIGCEFIANGILCFFGRFLDPCIPILRRFL
jgi:hypothetical protein